MENEEKLARLTEREKVCLRHWLQHKSAKEIAADLHISHHAVEQRLKMARTKLGTTSSMAAARLLSRAERYDQTVAEASDLTAPSRPSYAADYWPLILGAIIVTFIAAALLLLLQAAGDEAAHPDTVLQVRQGDEQLDLVLVSLTSSAKIGSDGEVILANPLSDQRYQQPQSGYYWQISAAGHQDLPSRSLWDRTLEVKGSEASLGEPLYYDSNQFPNQRLRVAQRSISLPGSDVEWKFIVARPREMPD